MIEFRIRDGLFVGRQNVGADFRIGGFNGELCVASVKVAPGRDRGAQYRICYTASNGVPSLAPAPPPGGLSEAVSGTADPASLAAAQGSHVVKLLVRDVATQDWLMFVAGAPPFVNSLSGRLRPVDIVTFVGGKSQRGGTPTARQPTPPSTPWLLR